MVKKILKNLGHLTKEQKEKTWATTLSGSQAWMLVNEPYNLIRDKLGVQRIHKSKYDFFNTAKMKTIGDNAKAQGTMYESTVLKELNQHIPEAFGLDETYQLQYLNSKDEVIGLYQVTCTPDWIVLDNNGDISYFGDIKCSTSAHDEAIMMDRYYYQLLHNAYVLGCNAAELDAKNEITKPLNRYLVEFTNQDFEDYEKKVLEFFANIQLNNVTAYDFLVLEDTKEQDNNDIENITRSADALEAHNLKLLAELKAQEKAIKSQIEDLEKYYKDNYTNVTVTFDGGVMVQKTSKVKGSVDNAKLVKDLVDYASISKDVLKDFEDKNRKADTFRKSITIKLNA